MSETKTDNMTNPKNEKPIETVIIAEDSAPNQKILQHLLTKLGYTVIACNNGQEAWNKLNDATTQNVVAVISDLMMPEMDGLTFLKKVRDEAKWKELPFVIVSAVSDKDQIVHAKSLNIHGYILKPVTFSRVVAKMKELFPTKVFPKIEAA